MNELQLAFWGALKTMAERNQQFPVLIELIEDYLNADYFADLCSQDDQFTFFEAVQALKQKIRARQRLQLFMETCR